MQRNSPAQSGAAILPARHTGTVPHRNSMVRNVMLVLAGTAFLALAAHIQVPFWPVKISMQTLAVIMIGMTYGSKLGAATVIAYVVEGAVGLPVFQSGAGIAYLAGPTGGYLLGFLLATFVIGRGAERGALERMPTAFGVIMLGIVAIYLPGVAWLGVLFGPEKSLAFGLYPFIPGEALKIALALALVPAARRVHQHLVR